MEMTAPLRAGFHFHHYQHSISYEILNTATPQHPVHTHACAGHADTSNSPPLGHQYRTLIQECPRNLRCSCISRCGTLHDVRGHLTATPHMQCPPPHLPQSHSTFVISIVQRVPTPELTYSNDHNTTTTQEKAIKINEHDTFSSALSAGGVIINSRGGVPPARRVGTLKLFKVQK
jgi:hypothetical protein